jgi:hypothetical protein
MRNSDLCFGLQELAQCYRGANQLAAAEICYRQALEKMHHVNMSRLVCTNDALFLFSGERLHD